MRKAGDVEVDRLVLPSMYRLRKVSIIIQLNSQAARKKKGTRICCVPCTMALTNKLMVYYTAPLIPPGPDLDLVPSLELPYNYPAAPA